MADPIAQGWITTAEAEDLTGYSRAYLRGLASRGIIEARKVGRDWLLCRESLEAYKIRMDALGDQRHNPWREDLAERGRGRKRPAEPGGGRQGGGHQEGGQ